MDLLAELRESISRTCEIPVDRIHPDSDLEELGVHSLASAEIVTDLEIRLGRDLPRGRLASVRRGTDRGRGIAAATQGTLEEASDRSVR